MIGKKIKILISGVLVSVLLISSPFNSRQVKAIVGVDDAILIATLGTLAVGGTLACYGISKSGVIQKTASAIGEGLQDIGNGFKSVYNDVAFAKVMYDMLPKILSTSKSLEGTEIKVQENNLETQGDYFKYPFSTTLKGTHILFSLEIIGNPNSIRFPVYNNKGEYISKLETGANLDKPINIVYRDNYNLGYVDLFTSYTNVYGDKALSTSPTLARGDFYLLIPNNYVPLSTSIYPTLSDVENPPTSISLSKEKAEAIALDYAEKNPNDNNGDKKVDYGSLIPFVLDMLEKDLGDGTITPENLSNSGIVSYVYKDGQTQGMYPYNFTDEGISNVNNSNTNNIIIDNGYEVSEEEKNGVLNLIDGGFRATSERFKSLNESFSGFKNTMSGIFSFFPQDVQNVLFLAIILIAVFFVLGLRR